MYLLVFLIAAWCFLVVSSESRPHHTTFESSDIPSNVTTEYLINLDESLSRCGQFQIDIRELTIPQIQGHFQSGRLTSTELTECYLKRIEKIDVYLKSVIEINPEAILLAKKADDERSANSSQSLNGLHGIPILIKDNIGTVDSMQTTAGALALEYLKPKRDADVVHRLRNAGAIILGKTNPSEWAQDDFIPSGWSGRGGQTICAYALHRDPSGSSTGSAVAVSVNLAAIALGTETDGSIISPSSRNALVGLKPTIGQVSTAGVIPLSFSNDVIGPMARSVGDAAILMGIMSDIDLLGCDRDVSTCLPTKEFKIGVLRDPFWNRDIIKPDLEACLDNLQSNKLALVIDVTSPVPIAPIEQGSKDIIFAHEFKFSLNNYLQNDVEHLESKVGRKISNLADIIEYNEMNPAIEGYKQNLLKHAEATDGLQNQTYLDARTKNHQNSITFIDAIFEKYDIDALATPCDTIDTENLYSYGAYAGYPSITVPVGIDAAGLPFGLCLLGNVSSEPVLLKLGFLVESSRTTERHTPRFARKPEHSEVQFWIKLMKLFLNFVF